MISESGLAVHV